MTKSARKTHRNVIALAFMLVLLTSWSAMAQSQAFTEKPPISLERPHPNTLFQVSQWTLYASAATDLATTWHGMSSQNRLEANPILGQSRLQQGTIVMGTAV